jgi:hypothetical protein
MNIDRYITDEVLNATPDFDDIEIRGVLGATLPIILAQHRADVLAGAEPIVNGIVAQAQQEARADALREAADAYRGGHPLVEAWLRDRADEAATDGR